MRLYFAEPAGQRPGERVFSVSLQGKAALADLDIARQAPAPGKTIIREFQGVEAARELKITFAARQGQPVLSGLRLEVE